MSSQRYQMPLVPLLALAALTAGCAADGSSTPEPTDPAATPSAEATTPTPELEDPTPPSNSSSTNPKVLDCTSEFIGGTGCDYDCSVSGDVLTSGDITITSTDSGTINIQGSDFDDDIKVETQGGDWLYVIDNTLLDNSGEGCVLGVYDQTKITSFTATGNSGDDIIDCDDDGLTIPVILNGNPGDDILKGGPMADTIRGHGDTDTLYGNGGADFLYGTGSVTTTDGFVDVIYGHDETSIGSEAEGACLNDADGDLIYCYKTSVVAEDCADEDDLSAHNCSRDGDILTTDNLTITTFQDGSVSIVGSSDDDRIMVSKGTSSTYGTVINILDDSSADPGLPVMTLYKDLVTTITINGMQGDDWISGAANNLGVPLVLYGHAGDDILKGSDKNDKLYGGDGSDKLYGGDGADELYGKLETNDNDGAVDALFGYDDNEPGSDEDTCAYSKTSPSDYTYCYPDVLYPNRDPRALDSTIAEAFTTLSGGRGPEVNGVPNYGVTVDPFDEDDTYGLHVQSLVYTGPFDNGAALLWYSRSDADGSIEGDEIKFNWAESDVMTADGGLEQDSDNRLANAGTINLTAEDHVSQIEWLPDYGAQAGLGYDGGYLFITSEWEKELLVYYYKVGELPVEITTSETRLSMFDKSESLNQVYVTKRAGYYWLVMGNKSDVDVYAAAQEALFPSGSEAGGQMNFEAFEYLYSTSPGSGGGVLCEFVTDADGLLYKLCYHNNDENNCSEGSGNHNFVYATEVTAFVDASGEPSITFGTEVHATADLGNWGGTEGCGSVTAACKYLDKPSFRAGGTHFVGDEGALHIYGIGFAGKETDETCNTSATNSSNGRTQVYMSY